MSLLDDIARRLSAAGVGWYSTTDAMPAGTVTAIYLNGDDTTPDRLVVLTLYPGPAPDSRNGHEYPRLQVRVRAPDPLDALALDAQVFGELQALAHVTLPSGVYLQDCYALQSAPAPLGQDDQGRWEYARNYQLETE